MRDSVTRWAQANAQTVDLFHRVFHGTPTQEDRDALSAWVTETVMRGYPLFDRSGDERAMDLPYVCDQEDCNARYAQAKGLGVHKRYAHGIKGTKGHPHTKASERVGPRIHVAAPNEAHLVPPEHIRAQMAPPPKPVIPEYRNVDHERPEERDTLAIFFTDVPLDALAAVFGPAVKLRVVAGKGLAVLKGNAP